MRQLLATVSFVALLAVAVGANGHTANAQAPLAASDTETRTATIQAIDYTARVVTLQFTDGSSKTIAVDPGVKRFPQLKVGDQVTFTQTDSVVLSIAKPGSAPAADSSTMTVAPGDKPGGTASKTVTAIVTVTAIDPAIPGITVKTADDRVLSFKVHDPKNLAGVKVGDQVQIAYTTSLVISVK